MKPTHATVSPYGMHHFVDGNGVATFCGIDLTETPWRRTWPVWEISEWPQPGGRIVDQFGRSFPADVCWTCRRIARHK